MTPTRGDDALAKISTAFVDGRMTNWFNYFGLRVSEAKFFDRVYFGEQ